MERAVELKKAGASGSGTGIGTGDGGVQDAARARDRLLQKINAAADLPALGSAVSRVVQMASSDDEAVSDLAHFILSDVALTQKILRIANTVSYRTASGRQVTTVSKAIFLLGLETVKTTALAMLLVDRLAGTHAQSVRNELLLALTASMVGREMARRSQHKDAEEAAIAALFKNIGRLLVAAHDHRLYLNIARLVESGTHTPAQASKELLGCSFDLLAESVLRSWNIPESIVHALSALPSGVLKPSKGRQEWMQQVASFSLNAAKLIPAMDDPAQADARNALLLRFGAAFNLDHARLEQLFASVAQESSALASDSELAPYFDARGEAHGTHADAGQSAAKAPAQAGLLNELLLDLVEESEPVQVGACHPSGKPLNARDLLLDGVLDVTQMMASGNCKLNDLMLLVLETLYSGMGFRFATVCLKEKHSNRFRARITVGENYAAREAGFVFQFAPGDDLFKLAMENNADLMISDAFAPKIRSLLPDWHRALLPEARSFIVLPLVVQNKQLGLFYADRAQPAPEGVPADETALIKTLKGQVLTALNSL
ncbi:HDOD domain-containing protein [Noviherbaspirillum sp. UKPF54]|nr:HDOD domain-containing protein [Noviherbaspirillum sp. UKPF54]